MDYQKIYDNIVANHNSCVKQKGFEGHHILPKSLGGSNDKTNIVFVPCRVHFILHKLLYKIYLNKEMGFALLRMSNYRRYNAKGYAAVRDAFSKFHPLKLDINKRKVSEAMKRNNPMSNPASLKKMSESQIGNKYRAVNVYEVTFPSGTKEIISEMKSFCEEHNLCRGHMSSVVTGNRKHHKGFTAKIIN